MTAVCAWAVTLSLASVSRAEPAAAVEPPVGKPETDAASRGTISLSVLEVSSRVDGSTPRTLWTDASRQKSLLLALDWVATGSVSVGFVTGLWGGDHIGAFVLVGPRVRLDLPIVKQWLSLWPSLAVMGAFGFGGEQNPQTAAATVEAPIVFHVHPAHLFLSVGTFYQSVPLATVAGLRAGVGGWW